jgi:N-acetylglucosamine kinase-like BadF-type ATPase
MVQQRREALVLGIDAGGSKTRACLAKLDLQRMHDTEGWRDCLQILGNSESGPGNPRSVGFEAVYENIVLATQGAFDVAGLPLRKVDSVCICMAGVGRADQREPVGAWCEQIQLGERIRISEDVSPIRWAALWETRYLRDSNQRFSESAGTASDWNNSVTLIAGTGSIVAASMGPSGSSSSQEEAWANRIGLIESELEWVRVGGWGYILGDEGSGYAIGLSALKEVCRAYDTGEELSPLHQILLKEMGCSSPIELIPMVYTQPIPRPKIASLYRHVVRHASSDLVASKLLEYAAIDLAELIVSGASRCGLKPLEFRLAFSGGTLLEKSPLVPAILRHLEQMQMQPAMSHQVSDPVLGAVVMASLSCSSDGGRPRVD